MSIKLEWKLLENETILGDDYNIFEGYVYIVDGIFTKSPASGKVNEWKELEGVKEIRRCDLFGHEGARLGDKVS